MEMRRIGLAAAVFVAPFASQTSVASPFDEVRAGILVQGFGPFESPDKEDGLGINGEVLFNPLEGLSFIGAPRPHLGFTVATAENATSQIYTGLTWEQHIARRFFLNGGLGVAVHDGETSFDPFDPDIAEKSFLGCRALFRVSGGGGVMLTERVSASVHLDHISNAGLCSENEGLDNLGARLGYRF
jgi:lipid A 3-O-deacylase